MHDENRKGRFYQIWKFIALGSEALVLEGHYMVTYNMSI